MPVVGNALFLCSGQVAHRSVLLGLRKDITIVLKMSTALTTTLGAIQLRRTRSKIEKVLRSNIRNRVPITITSEADFVLLLIDHPLRPFSANRLRVIGKVSPISTSRMRRQIRI